MHRQISSVGLALAFTLIACSPVAATVTLPPPSQVTSLPGVVSSTETLTPEPAATLTQSPTPENIPDLSGESITLPVFCDKSSVLASSNNARIQAMEDVTQAINAQGGIFGAELELRVVDTEGTAEAAQRALARIVREIGEGPLVLICDPQTGAAIQEMLNEDEIPAIGPSDFAERGGFIFGLDAKPQDHLGYFLNDLFTHWSERKPLGTGNEIRVALISWPPETSGSMISDDFLADLGELGVEIVFQAGLPAEPQANIFDAIYHARDANANVIYTNLRGFGLAELLNALNALGLRERFVVGTPAAGYDSQLFEYLANPAYVNGLYLTSPWAWWTEENAGIQFLSSLSDSAELRDWGYIEMAGAVSMAQQVLQMAVLEDGFSALSPEAATRALEALEDYPVMSGLYTVDFSGGSRTQTELRTWVAGEDGELVLIQ